jgi:hypothetical protein
VTKRLLWESSRLDPAADRAQGDRAAPPSDGTRRTRSRGWSPTSSAARRSGSSPSRATGPPGRSIGCLARLAPPTPPTARSGAGR